MRRILVGAMSTLFAVTGPFTPAVDQSAPRVPFVSDHPSDPAVAKMFDDTRAKGEQILNTYRISANAPEIFLASYAFAQKLRFAAKVPRIYRELVILRASQIENGDYEYVHHVPLALSCGITQAQIDALPRWRKSGLFDPKQRAVLAFSDGMSTKAGPDDATFRTLASFFTSQEIVELAMNDGYYISRAHIGTALGIPLESNGGAGSIPHGC